MGVSWTWPTAWRSVFFQRSWSLQQVASEHRYAYLYVKPDTRHDSIYLRSCLTEAGDTFARARAVPYCEKPQCHTDVPKQESRLPNLNVQDSLMPG